MHRGHRSTYIARALQCPLYRFTQRCHLLLLLRYKGADGTHFSPAEVRLEGAIKCQSEEPWGYYLRVSFISARNRQAPELRIEDRITS